ncbi:hypothetical protein N665_0892s0002 [Sinapis alba]|nr:hypothetical protein N665_0892s0002 [Sinapis alba]
MTDASNTPIDTTINQTPLNIVETDATVTTAGIIALTDASTTTTTLPVGNGADEITRRSLFGAGLYQTGSNQRTTSAPVAVVTPSAVPGMISQRLMPDKFDGKDFKTWQKKMLFLLTTMKLDKFIQEDKPIVPYEIEYVHTLASVGIGPLRLHLQRVEAFQPIYHEIAAEGLSICETFKTLSFIQKLPPSYVDFKDYLKHNKKKMGLEELIKASDGIQKLNC